ncbi:mannose-6-phosphate isomerase [Ktedonobacter sp. SOSP1-52]|uniref:cupin domain-containing protein n=1 Tax=Ktedonobacter sp. SOSP1-52 TaxID=2778366 RepID=UPI0019165257|nr:cupin domain-containing protein [Ktedonobacter sp. SOSP1-52]GHO71017.1 mannose-6-phosphate isomerase [Ktedonobacter sp. SOSP1-52]
MSGQEGVQPGLEQQATVRVIKPSQFDANTPQTPGMERVAAVSRELAGSQGIWAGITVVQPRVASGVHHHGELETVIYVVSGHSQVRWGEGMQYSEEVEPGDFIYIPPFVPHQEINPSPDTPSRWVIIRTGQEPIVVNLEPEASAPKIEENKATHPQL